MASDPQTDDDLSPQDFLRRVREMTEERDREDRQRVTDIEKDILQSREQRRARRADHARSLSNAPIEKIRPLSAQALSTPSSIIPAEQNSKSPTHVDSPTTLARSGTLSWQQRRRPLSQIALENNRLQQHPSPEPATTSPQKEQTRADIALSLAAKDPSWFKQTAERGIGSAALRRTPEPEAATEAFKMPGMETRNNTEGSASSATDVERSNSPSRAGSSREGELWSNRNSAATTVSDAELPSLRSSSVYDAPALTPPREDMASSASSGRMSPTKGLGGFVQSAMMKRSDSVNKRWSATTTPGLQRAGSTASNRGGLSGRVGSVKSPGVVNTVAKPQPDSRLSGLVTVQSTESTSRPSSTYSDYTITQNTDDRKDVVNAHTMPLQSNAGGSHGRSKSVASLLSRKDVGDDQADFASPPASPSKRWSPTKSTWLESKLSQPEEKAKSTPPPAQPSWMVDIAKAKQQRMSAAIEPPDLASSRKDTEPIAVEEPASIPAPTQLIISAQGKSTKAEKPDTNPIERPLLRKTSSTMSPKIAPKPAAKTAEVGKLDFRSNLRSRAAPPPKQTEAPEFQTAFGKLKRANTEKFVAPDELKNNILRGKAGLSQTGGPAKKERVDELKESLLKKKEEMKIKAAIEPKKPEIPMKANTPEALAIRQRMNKVELPRSFSSLEDDPKPLVIKSASPTLPKMVTKPQAPSVLGQEASGNNRSIRTHNDTDSKSETTSELRGSTTASPSNPTVSKQSVMASKLANKINPALASILARGTPGMSASSDARTSPSTISTRELSQEARELTHMTKGRARGPKRRAPKLNETPFAGFGDSKSNTLTAETSQSQAAPEVPGTRTTNVGERSISSVPLPLATTPGDKVKDITSLAVNKKPEVRELPRTGDTSDVVFMQLPSNPELLATNEHAVKLAKPVTPPRSSASRPISTLQNREMSSDKLQLTPNKVAAAKFGGFDFGLDAFDIENGSLLISPEPTKNEFDKSETLKRQSTKIIHLDLQTPASSQPGSPARSPTRSPGQISVREAIAKEVITPGTAPLDFRISMSRHSSPTRSAASTSVRDTIAKEVRVPASAPLESAKPKLHPESPSKSPVTVSVKDAASRWSSSGAKTVLSGRVKSPIKLPNKDDEDRAMTEAGLVQPSSEPSLESSTRSPAPCAGLGLANVPAVADTVQAPDRVTKSPHSITQPVSADTASTPAFTISPAIRSRPSSTQSGFNPPVSPTKRSRPPSMTIRVPPPDSPSSPIPYTSEAARMFSEVFDDQPRISGSTNIDVITVIETYPLSKGKLETIKSQMQELGPDGQLIPMDNGREHILFEDSMYICVHIFRTEKGARTTEVYFWSGHNVVPADAIMFARNVAKANTGKLIPITQGKEPPAFFQALGGIVITFRGSRVKKRKSTGLPEKYMLCGRKHLGHIAFDEVDFARSSFCSGFPFLISDKKKLYLWRGAGSSADELGCARLIAMDIGLTPDVQEIEEGHEPASFLNLFPTLPSAKAKSPGIPPSATHWQLKASLGDKYRTRLFRVTQEAIPPPRKNSAFQVSNFFGGWASSAAGLLSPSLSPSTPTFPALSSASSLQSPFTELSEKKSFSLLGTNINPITPKSPGPQSEIACNVDEIVPFCREDLLGEGVWVLDAFFEVYIILSPLSHSQNHAFSAALLFAQDYVILAASVEDRPFIPVSTVVLEGAPKDMKAVFRRWTNIPGGPTSPSLPTSRLMAGKPLKRGGSMRVVGLAAALAAIQR